MTEPDPPFALLAELTHRCPLRCPYCSNPLEMVRRSQELDTDTWKRVLSESAELGALQVHFSGGEPTARDDIEELVQHATDVGLYSNLITSGILTDDDQLGRLQAAGLAHVQVSVQDIDVEAGDEVAGYPGAQSKKHLIARNVDRLGMALTVNAVIHRRNINRIEAIIDMAVNMKAQRMEIANAQYYGWGLKNRSSLMPTLEQLGQMNDTVLRKIKELNGVIVIDYVVPDYFARRPKACMSGWGRRFFNVSPDGKVLPCHAAETIPDMSFDNVTAHSVAWIWRNSAAFNRFRGTEWMPEPCQSCDRREIDWGGCRCQALALTGSAANPDPACERVAGHAEMRASAVNESTTNNTNFVYRNFSNRELN